jgi:16S rRNA (guanine(966)-N(2))-methyltransferase RsmD
MRVIAGDYKGRRLLSPAGYEVRPTSDKVKGAIFNMLAEDVPGAVCLDLFAGTGSLGIEALSRGASKCLFSDSSAESIALLKENLKTVGAEGKSTVYQGDFRTNLRRIREKVDIAFIDPPYESGYYNVVMQFLVECDIMENEGLLVLERGGHRHETAAYSGFTLLREKSYGKVFVDVYMRTE